MTTEQLKEQNERLRVMVERAERMAELMRMEAWRRQFGHQSNIILAEEEQYEVRSK